MLYTRTLNSDQQTETVVRQRALLSVVFSVVCDARVWRNNGLYDQSDVAAVIIILYVRRWSQALLCCIWKLPNLS